MISEIFAEHPWLGPLAWQSTLCLAAGLGGSFLLRRHAVRAHQILLLGLVAAVLIPVLSQIVKRNQWGLLVAERAVATPEHRPLPAPADVVIPDPPVPTEPPDLLPPTGALEAAPVPANTRFDWTRAVLPAWLALSSALLLRLAIQFLLGRRLVRRSEAVDEVPLLRMIDAAKGKLGIQSEVRVRASARARSPVIWCWGRRLVLLVPPESRSNEGLDWPSILCHELAHAKRRDHVSGLLAELMVCSLPWQPLVWWARQHLAVLSEEACDDWVIACGQRATGYARTLLGLTPQAQAALLPGVVTSRRGLAGRVRRILEDGCGNPRPGLGWTLAAVALAAGLSLGIAFAQARPAESKTITTNQGAPTSLSIAAAGEGATLGAQALLAGWKAHYGGIHRMHVRLSEKATAGGDREDDPPLLRNMVRFQIADLTIDKDTKRFHLLYSQREGGLDDPLRAYESAFDGKVTKQYWGDGPRRQGGVAPGARGNNPRLLLNHFERYLLLLHVGLPPSGLVIVGVPPDFSFQTVALMDYLSDLAKAGGDSIVVKPTLEAVAHEPCHVLEVKQDAGGKGQPAMKLWFAQGKGMLPMKFQLLGGGVVFQEIVVLDTAKSETDTGVMWYPSKARFTQRGPWRDEAGNEVMEELSSEQQVFAFTPNVKVDDSTFQFAFPGGTLVRDEVEGSEYTVDGFAQQGFGAVQENGARATLATVRVAVARNEARTSLIKMDYALQYASSNPEQRSQNWEASATRRRKPGGASLTRSRGVWAQDGVREYLRQESWRDNGEKYPGDVDVIDGEVWKSATRPDFAQGAIDRIENFEWGIVAPLRFGPRLATGKYALREVLEFEGTSLHGEEGIGGRGNYVLDTRIRDSSFYARIWIDKEAGLPLRVHYYDKDSSSADRKPIAELRDVQLHRLPNGGWVPVKGTENVHFADETVSTRLDVDVKSITIERADIPDSLFSLEFPKGARVYNAITSVMTQAQAAAAPQEKTVAEPNMVLLRLVDLNGRPASSPTASARVVRFPADRSVGMLYLREWDFPTENYEPMINWQWLDAARGDITVPTGKRLLRIPTESFLPKIQ